MSLMSAFNMASGLGATIPAASSGPVTIRAGRCAMQQQPTGKFLVTADPRRGQISISKDRDGRIIFRWTAHGSTTPEEERLLPAGSALFKRVKTGRETDRVYMLKISATNERSMFWMQSMNDSKDAENAKRANDMFAAALDFASLLSNFNMSHPQSAIPPSSAAVASTPAPATTVTSTPMSSTSAITLDDLRRAMNGGVAATPATSSSSAVNNNITTATPSTTTPAPAPARATRLPELQDILTGEEIIRSGILSDPQVQADLLQHLPAEQQTVEHLRSTVRSAQFQQSLGSLSHALHQGDNFQQIATGFALNASAGTESLLRSGDPVRAFIDAVEQSQVTNTNNNSTTDNNNAQQPPQTPSNNNNATDNKDEDNSMDE